MAASLPYPGRPEVTASGRLTGHAGLKGWLRGRRYRFRLVAGMLGMILPLMVGFAAILTAQASSSLSASSERKGMSVARAVRLRLEDWLRERGENLSTIANQASGRLADPLTASLASEVDHATLDFTVIEVTDLTGRVLASSRPERSFDPTGQDSFRSAAAGQPVLDSLVAVNGHLRWTLDQPVLDASGRPEGVVVGDLDPTALATLLNPSSTGEATSSPSMPTASSSTTPRWASQPTTSPCSPPAAARC
ncbi:MAG: cache domain-containing protein [Candidatus Dormibacteria bacterium]